MIGLIVDYGEEADCEESAMRDRRGYRWRSARIFWSSTAR